MIYPNGRVFWPVPTKLQSTCKFDVTFFPFDIQTCYIKIGKILSVMINLYSSVNVYIFSGSWTYDGFQV